MVTHLANAALPLRGSTMSNRASRCDCCTQCDTVLCRGAVAAVAVVETSNASDHKPQCATVYACAGCVHERSNDNAHAHTVAMRVCVRAFGVCGSGSFKHKSGGAKLLGCGPKSFTCYVVRCKATQRSGCCSDELSQSA
eukprot:4741-Heterococcus_DN1.PRE.4